MILLELPFVVRELTKSAEVIPALPLKSRVAVGAQKNKLAEIYLFDGTQAANAGLKR